jgi:hypothetical protein
MSEFEVLQEQLGAALRANAPGSLAPHVIVSLPSHSMPQRLLTHHASHLPALEHRGLLDGLQVGRTPGAQVIVVTSVAPSEAVLDYYAHLAQPDSPRDARRRVTCLVVPDAGARGVAAKLLDRPELVKQLRQQIGGKPVFIEPWNVTFTEVAVALELGAPVNGGPHELWPLGFKSASRRLFRKAAVPMPLGVEDVHDGAEVAAAVDEMRRAHPFLDRVVVKLDNSGAAQGNWVLPTRDDTGRKLSSPELRSRIDAVVPAWFLSDLKDGGVVEELVVGPEVTSPSAQAVIRPGGDVSVVATHEQILGGQSGQAFTGSQFPADPSYAGALAEHTGAVGRVLAGRGALGWLAVDFMARKDDDGWALAAVDLNLRKGGTTHSYTALQHLVPGHYDPTSSQWVADADGSSRYYRSSDAVGGPRRLGMEPSHAINSLAAAGLAFDHAQGTGVVLHMFPSLDRDGTLGATAIGRSAAEAQSLYDAIPAALELTDAISTG